MFSSGTKHIILNISVLLFLKVHVLEVVSDYQRAMDVIIKFCDDSLTSSSKSSEPSYSKLFIDTIRSFKAILKSHLTKDVYEPYKKRKANCKKLSAEELQQKFEVVPIAKKDTSAKPSVGDDNKNLPPYSSDELDLLAIFFTAVKVHHPNKPIDSIIITSLMLSLHRSCSSLVS